MSLDLETPVSRRGFDHVFIASTLLLTGLGLATLYSSSYAFAERFFNGDGLYIFSRQLILGAIGMFLFFAASRVRLELLRVMVKPLVLLAMALCCLTFVPGFADPRNGASRWIRMGGYTYQPSELVKLVLPIYLAHIFAKKGAAIDVFSRGVLPPVLITAFFYFVIYQQNNFSTALFVAVNAILLFFFAGLKFWYFLGAIVLFLPLSIVLIFTKAHRVYRLLSFIAPEQYALGAAYQVRSSILSIVSGGFWGKGIGQGVRKIASVPEIHSDFIFSAFAEETGFLGVFLFMVIFVLFTVRGYRAALGNEETFPRLLGLGLVTMIATQALINIAVVAGAVPATGVPLPFFSAGGSSLITTLIAAGLVSNISRTAAPEAKEAAVFAGEAA